MSNFSAKTCRENQNTYLCTLFFPPKSHRLWDNVEKYRRARQATDENKIRRMQFACCITKTTEAHLEYVTLNCFPVVKRKCLYVKYISTLSYLRDAVNSPNDKMVSDDELERCGPQRLWHEHDPVICLNQACQISNPRDVYGPFDSCDCLRNFPKTLWVRPKD
jgi:hypothetical protein